MSKGNWKTLSSKIAYKNKWYQVRENKVITPLGEEGLYCVVESSPIVFIVALTDDNQVNLIKLFRYTTQQSSWEVPAGKSEEGEDLLKAAKRELQEETGLQANSWKEIGAFQYASGISSGISHIFIAKKLVQTDINKKAEEGIEKNKVFSYKEILKMIRNNKITNGQSIVALTKVALYLGIIN